MYCEPDPEFGTVRNLARRLSPIVHPAAGHGLDEGAISSAALPAAGLDDSLDQAARVHHAPRRRGGSSGRSRRARRHPGRPGISRRWGRYCETAPDLMKMNIILDEWERDHGDDPCDQSWRFPSL